GNLVPPLRAVLTPKPAGSGSTLTLSCLRQPGSRKPSFRQAGKPRIALTKHCAKITTRRNSSEWSAPEKPFHITNSRAVPPAGKFVSDFGSGSLHTGAGEGI